MPAVLGAMTLMGTRSVRHRRSRADPATDARETTRRISPSHG
jgi:hypothetical protein